MFLSTLNRKQRGGDVYTISSDCRPIRKQEIVSMAVVVAGQGGLSKTSWVDDGGSCFNLDLISPGYDSNYRWGSVALVELPWEWFSFRSFYFSPLPTLQMPSRYLNPIMILLICTKKVPLPSLVMDSGDHNCTAEAARRCILAVEGWRKFYTWNLNVQPLLSTSQKKLSNPL